MTDMYWWACQTEYMSHPIVLNAASQHSAVLRAKLYLMMHHMDDIGEPPADGDFHVLEVPEDWEIESIIPGVGDCPEEAYDG